MATPSASVPTVLAWSLLALPLVIAETTNTKSTCGQHLRYRKPLTESLEWQTYSVPLMIVLGAGCALAWCILFITYDVSQRGKEDLPQIPSAEEMPPTLGDQEGEKEAMFQVEKNKIIDENIGIPLSVDNRPLNEDNRSATQLYPEPTIQTGWSPGQPYAELSQTNVVLSQSQAEPTSQTNGSLGQLNTQTGSQNGWGLGQSYSESKIPTNGNVSQQYIETTGQSNGSLAQLNIQAIKEDNGSLTKLASQPPSQENVVPPLQEESSPALHKSSQTEEEESGGDSFWTFIEHELEKLLTALRLHRCPGPSPPVEETPAPPVEEIPAPPVEQPSPPAEEILSHSRIEENQATMHLIICEVPRNEVPVRGRGRKRRTSKGGK